jgi:hypothetical protein
VPKRGRHLIALLGSTIGNLDRRERRRLLGQVVSALDVDDAFLVGVDLAKPPEVLIAAYDDAAGVTAAFNRNVFTCSTGSSAATSRLTLSPTARTGTSEPGGSRCIWSPSVASSRGSGGSC